MKGQVSIEFLGTFTIAMLILIIYGAFVVNTFGSLTPQNPRTADAQLTADEVARAINYAWLAGDGYQGNLTLKEQLKGRDYIVNYSVENKIIEVNTQEEDNRNATGFAHVIADNFRILDVGPENTVTNSNNTVTFRGIP